MALFSRGPKKHEQAEPVDEAAASTPAGGAADSPADAAVPDVPITVTAYGAAAGAGRTPASAPVSAGPTAGGTAGVGGTAGAGATAGAGGPAAGAGPRPTAGPAASVRRPAVPGIEDNALLIDALAKLDPKPTSSQTFEVARQLLQGRVYLRVRGDAGQLLATGGDLPMATATIGDAQCMLAFSGGAALQAAVRADGDTGTSAVAIGVPALLRQMIDGPFAGLAIDLGSSPAAVVLPRALVERILADLDETLAVKSALTGHRTEDSVAALVAALRTAPLWIAARRQADGSVGIAQARMQDGTRVLEIFSHPLELHVLGRGDQSVRITAAQLAAALHAEPDLAGVVVNPQGPWLRLSRTDLAPLLAGG